MDWIPVMTREKSYLPRNVWEQGMWIFSLKSIPVPPAFSFWASDTGGISSGYHSKYHRLSGSYNRNVFSHSPEGLLGRPKSKISVPADCVSGKSSLPGLQMVAFPLCSHGLFFVCMERESFSLSCSSYEDTNLLRGAPPSRPHLNLIISQSPLLLIPSQWQLGSQHIN